LAARNASTATAIEPLLGIKDLTTILGVSRRLLERERSAGKFPPPDLTIGRMPRWQRETIARWIANAGKN
jgi:predicted DNA-binding transcriptional regulator AlpA